MLFEARFSRMELTIFQHIDYRTLLLMGGVLALFMLFLFGHKKQQQRIRSGNEVARKEGQNINNQFNINLPFYITRPGIWCRVSADFEFISKAKHGFTIRHEQSQHWFELGLQNQTERTLINEAQPFRTFLGFSWSRSKQYS